MVATIGGSFGFGDPYKNEDYIEHFRVYIEVP